MRNFHVGYRIAKACKNACFKGDVGPPFYTWIEGPEGPLDNICLCHQDTEPYSSERHKMATWSPGGSHDDATILFPPCSSSPPSPPACSAGSADRAAWRNPLSRHFSFPLTDGPWRARAFGPPAWLAARQLNKLSSCYNSLKHFQLPQSNKCCRRDAWTLLYKIPNPSGCFPCVSGSAAHSKNTCKNCASPAQSKHARQRGKREGTTLMISDFSSNFCSLPLFCPSMCGKDSKQEPLDIK